MASFSSLSNEIINHIFSLLATDVQAAYFAPHEVGLWRSEDKNTPQDDYFRALQPLRILSLVSRSVHFVAKKLLYRSEILETQNLRNFLRSILANLDLRSLVWDISFEFDEYEDTRRTSYDGHLYHPYSNDYENCDPLRDKDLGNPAGIVLDLFRKAARGAGMLGQGGLGDLDWNSNHLLESLSAVKVPSTCDSRILRGTESGINFTSRIFADAEAALLLFFLTSVKSVRFSGDSGENEEVAGEWAGRDGLFKHLLLLAILRLPDKLGLGPTRELSDGTRDPSTLAASVLPSALQTVQGIVMHDPYPVPGTIKAEYPPIQFWPLEWLAPVLFLPHLKKAEFERCMYGWRQFENRPVLRATPPIDSTEYGGAIPLEDLSLSSTVVPSHEVKRLIKLTKALKRFKYELPDLFSLRLSETYSPATFPNMQQICEALLPQKVTLETIELHGLQRQGSLNIQEQCAEEVWHGYPDGEITTLQALFADRQRYFNTMLGTVDLSPFANLKKASVDAADLSGWMERNEPAPRISIIRLMPPSLEELSLRYDDCFSNVALHMDMPQIPPTRWFDGYFEHLHDLIAARSTGELPNLQKLTIDLPEHWPALADLLADLHLAAVQNRVLLALNRHRAPRRTS